MKLIVTESLTFLIYIGLFIYIGKQLSQQTQLTNKVAHCLLLGLIGHGLVVYWHIDGEIAQNLSLFNIFCMTTWLAMCLVSWNLYKHKAHSLLLVTLPLAALSIIEVALFSSESLIQLNGKLINLFHIISGVAAMSVLMLAALQSALVLYLDNGLRNHPAKIHRWLGPLQSMERYLIQLLLTGFVLMSVSLILVLLLPDALNSTQAVHKVVLTIASWCVLATLVFGRYIRGWRGVFTAKWSLFGVFLLLLGYFGSKLVLEFILK